MNNKVNRTRPCTLAVRTTPQEVEFVHSVKAKFNLTLLELMLKGIEALEREALTNQTNKEAN